MFIKKINLLFKIIVILTISACESGIVVSEVDINDPNPEISDIPVIELSEVAPTTAQQFTDSIKFSISYMDGDGDLGTTNPDQHTIELVDNRENLIFTYHLSPRTPDGTEIAIQGTLDVILDNTIILDPANTSETATFSIRIRDRAGNWSNIVTSEEVTILE